MDKINYLTRHKKTAMRFQEWVINNADKPNSVKVRMFNTIADQEYDSTKERASKKTSTKPKKAVRKF